MAIWDGTKMRTTYLALVARGNSGLCFPRLIRSSLQHIRQLVLISVCPAILTFCMTQARVTQEPIMSESIRNEQLDLAIRKLWSSNEQERITAKKQILEIGAKSINSLTSLL